jgi:uncharacterized protein
LWNPATVLLCLAVCTPLLAQQPAGATAPATPAAGRPTVETTALDKACAAKDVQACLDLARLYLEGKATGWCDEELALATLRRTSGVDDKEARKPRRQACERGDGAACFTLGTMYAPRGVGWTSDLDQAAQLFKRACDGGYGLGCVYLGHKYDRGVNATRDEVKAAQLYERGCQAGCPLGCLHLGEAYALARGVPRDAVQAARLFRQACDQGSATGCRFLAERYDTGWKDAQLAQDQVEAMRLYQTACDARVWKACTVLARRSTNGNGAPQDRTLGARLYNLACENHDAEACLELADQSQAACDTGDMMGCLQFARLQADQRLTLWWGVPRAKARDPRRAVGLFRRVCGAGRVDVCLEAGARYDGAYAGAKSEATYFYRKACEGGSAPGCWHLGWMYDGGVGVRRNLRRAASLYRKACDASDATGCYHAALACGADSRPTCNEGEALGLLGRACDGGLAKACHALGVAHDFKVTKRPDGTEVSEVQVLVDQYYHEGETTPQEGCIRFVMPIMRGLPTAATPDRQRAATFYQKACDAGHAPACAALAKLTQ